MKQIFVIFMALLAQTVAFSQGEWKNYGRTPILEDRGIWLNGGVTNIYRNTAEFPALGEGHFEAGLSFGRNTAFVLKVGVYTQSDFFSDPLLKTQIKTQSWGVDFYGWGGYDYGCGCYPQQQSNSNKFQYLRIGHFQVGISDQGRNHGIRGTVGAGGFDYQIPTIDSLSGEEVPFEVARGTVFALGFDAKIRLGKDLLSGRLQSFTDVKRLSMDGTIGKVEIDYLFGFEKLNGKVYTGLGVSAKKHVVSGDEYTIRVILEGGHNKIPFWVRTYFGMAYNPTPEEGIGWELGFQMSVDRFAKSIYRK